MKLLLVPALTGLLACPAWALNPVVSENPAMTASADQPDAMAEDSSDEFLAALGALPASSERNFGETHAKCPGVKLTEEQKKSLKEAFFAAKKEKIQLRAQLKLAKMDYIQNLTSEKGEAAIASKLGDEINKDVSALVANHINLANQVFFTILTPEQRQPVMACHHHMKDKHKKCGASHSHHHGSSQGDEDHGSSFDESSL